MFAKLRDFVTGRGRSLDLFPSETLCRWDKRIEQTFEVGVKLEEHGEYVYRLCIRHEAPERALNKVVEESLFLNGKPLFEGNDQEIQIHEERQSGSPAGMQPDWHVSGISRVYERPENKKLIAFKKAFESTLILRLNPGLVKSVAIGKQPVEIPTPDCSDFAGWLRHISTAESLIGRRAEQSLAQGSLPGFLYFQVTPSGDSSILECYFESKPKPLKFRLDELSSGQIALIILEVAMAAATERGGALLLDEPSNFLGLPEIQPLLVRLEDAALEGRFQVVLTAHHPIAVDLLAASHGLWLEEGTNRPCACSSCANDRFHPGRQVGHASFRSDGARMGFGFGDFSANRCSGNRDRRWRRSIMARVCNIVLVCEGWRDSAFARGFLDSSGNRHCAH